MNNSDDHSNHVLPLWVYLGVFSALLVLTVTTVAVAQVDLGTTANLIIAMVVACVKAGLVALFFMHLLYDKKIYLYVFMSSLVCLTIFIIFTGFDIFRRDAINPVTAQPIQAEGKIYPEIRAKAATLSGHKGADTH
jgi:cytochrome c oxidase subunit 4